MLLTVANAMLVLRTRLGKLSFPVLAVELVAGGEGKPLPPGSIAEVEVWSWESEPCGLSPLPRNIADNGRFESM